MATVKLTIKGVFYPEGGGTAQEGTLVGDAWYTDLKPEHPIVLPDPPIDPGNPPIDPPIDPPPPDELPPDTSIVKPPPPDGGWGWSPAYGWGYFPGTGGAQPKKK